MDPGAFFQLNPVVAFNVTGGTGGITMKGGSGAIVARTGAGVYTVTFSGQAFPASESFGVVTLRQSGTYSYVDTSDTVKTISTFAVDGTTATDKNFSVVIYYVPPGQ